jgi:hypothetical protein
MEARIKGGEKMEVNIGRALVWLFPDADPLSDYTVVNDENGQQIIEWHLDDPIPSASEIEAAYAAAIEEDANRAEQPTNEEKLEQLTVENDDLKTRLEQAESDNLTALAAITELYEMILTK